MVEIKEGSATMYYDTSETVFYNKVQVLNRDISIQVIKLFSERIQAERDAKYRQKLATFEASTQISPKTTQKEPLETAKTPPTPPERGIRILDALAATGLRSIRYLKEIPLSRHVTINDIEQIATLKASQNIAQNHIPEDKVAEIHHGDAVIYMHTHRNEYDVIDLGKKTYFLLFLSPFIMLIAQYSF